MKKISLIFVLAGLFCAPGLRAQNNPPPATSSNTFTPTNGGLTKAGAGTLTLGGANGSSMVITSGSTSYTMVMMADGSTVMVPSGVTVSAGGSGWSGSFSFSGAALAPYGSGRYPNLQTALVQLQNAQVELQMARSDDKGDYLNRALIGTQMAIDHARFAVDNADSKPVPAFGSLPSLPDGLGAPQSKLTVPPLKDVRVQSPHLDAALASLNAALIALKKTDPQDATGTRVKGAYLPRSMDDVAFAIANVKAAENMVNGAPATEDADAAAPVDSANPAAPMADVNFALIEGSVIGGVFLLGAIGFLIQRLRKPPREVDAYEA